MIQKGWRPGLVGEIVRAHAIYYARDWNFPRYFEAKVAREMGEFLARTSDRDALFSAEADDAFVARARTLGCDTDDEARELLADLLADGLLARR